MAQTIQIRRGTAAQFTAANPTLAVGEPAFETDTKKEKIGDGTTVWNSLPYRNVGSVSTAEEVILNRQVVRPTAPTTDKLKLYTRALGGRLMTFQQGPSGVSTPLQPSFFQNQIVIISPNTTTSVSTLGQSVTSVGTLSHPNPTTQYGYMTNFISAATAGATAGTGNATAMWLRGTNANDSCGFFFNSRVAFPDGSYNQTAATTGTRIFVGLTAGTMAQSVGSDNPAYNTAGFFRCHVNGGLQHTNWQFRTRDSLTTTLIDTGLPFLVGKVYDMFIFCPPGGTTIGWRIDNVTDDITMEGSTSDTLPDSSTYMRAGIQLQTVNAVARNIRMQRIYTESDR